MKKLHLSLLACVPLAFMALKNDNYQTVAEDYVVRDTIPIYIDLHTGDTLDLWYDSVQQITTNRRNNQRVYFYLDPMTLDTFYGTGGLIVNNLIVRTPDGKYSLDSTKVKVENNKIKINDGDQKVKMKWEENKMKMKDREGKYKLKNKGDSLKIKEKNS